jgi:hypothetical protein
MLSIIDAKSASFLQHGAGPRVRKL